MLEDAPFSTSCSHPGAVILDAVVNIRGHGPARAPASQEKDQRDKIKFKGIHIVAREDIPLSAPAALDLNL